MSGQRARSAVAADHRSAHPNIAGIPWWAAVLLAVTATAIGFAFDAGSGNRELSFVFSACYALGCVLAVLAVRQAGVFTAVIQPPLILFVAVPGAYFLFHGSQLTGFKDTLINCGYPLVERFPLMFFTSAAVLLIGMARWYYGASTKCATPTTTSTRSTGLVALATAKISAIVKRGPADQEQDKTPRRRHSVDRPRRTTKATPGEPTPAARPAKRTKPSRSRHARPPETGIIEPVVDRPRRSRSTRRAEPPPEPPAEPRRRSRSQSTREPRNQPPTDRRSAYERPQRRRRFDDYEPLEPHGTNGRSTHHPISRVRYRSVDDGDNRAEYRTRPRPSRNRDAAAWEYDV